MGVIRVFVAFLMKLYVYPCVTHFISISDAHCDKVFF